MSSLESQKQAVLNRQDSSAPFTVVALHCEQMREWGTRGGNIELRPVQDTIDKRRKTLCDRIWFENQLEQRLDYIMDCFTCRGEILWLVLPDKTTKSGYTIDFYVGGLNNPDPQYRVFFKHGGRQIERVSICYDYEAQGNFNSGQYVNTQDTKMVKKWVRIDIDAETIKVHESLDQKPDLLTFQGTGNTFNDNVKSYPNSFTPFLPVVVCKNNQRKLGQEGSDDFSWIQSLIETHDKLVSKSYHNLNLFSNPIFVTSRSQKDVMGGGGGANTPTQTWGSANRFVSNDLTGYSTNTADIMNYGEVRYPGGRSSVGGLETSAGTIDTIISDVGQDERFGFVQPPAPVGGDQNTWIKQIRELIHWCLGGVDPVGGLTSGSTWGEVRTLFGRVQNTADKKMSSLMKFGLCDVFEKILYREEFMWKTQFFDYINRYFPNTYPFKTAEELPDEMCQQFYQAKQQNQLPYPMPEFQGLVPFGDRTVNWRYTRDVFQLTTRERLDLSIAARNDREDGLSQEYVLRQQHPDMTDQEVKNVMSGFSPRVVQNALGAIQGLIQLNGALMQMPSPEDPKMPWAITLGLPSLIGQGVKTLEKELEYGVPIYEDSNKTSSTYFPLDKFSAPDYSVQNPSINGNITNNNEVNSNDNFTPEQLTINSPLNAILRTIASLANASPISLSTTSPSSTVNANAGFGVSSVQSAVPERQFNGSSFWAGIDPNQWREYGVSPADARAMVARLQQPVPESVPEPVPEPVPAQPPSPPKRKQTRRRTNRRTK